MFTISVGQLDALSEGVGRRFEQRLVVHVAAAFADEAQRIAASDGGLLGFVRTCIERAEAIRIVDDPDIACYIVLVLANLKLGPDKAEVLAWTKPMLDRTSVPGGLKMEWILWRLGDFAADDADAAMVLPLLQAARRSFAS